MLYSVLQQDRTTLFHLSFSGLAPFVALVLIWLGSIPSAWRRAIGLQHARPHSKEVLKKSERRMDTTAPFLLSLPFGKKSFLFPPCFF